VFSAFAGFGARAPKPKSAPAKANGSSPKGALAQFRARLQARRQSAVSRGAFPRILDQYVVVEFLNMFALVLMGFILLMLVFTVFDLLGDILRNHIKLATVGDYLINLTPLFLYQLAPLASFQQWLVGGDCQTPVTTQGMTQVTNLRCKRQACR